MQVLEIDGLTIDGVDVMDVLVAVDEFLDSWQELSDTVIRPSVARGWQRFLGLSRATITAGRQHRAEYGAQYAAAIWTALGLLAMLVRAQLGREGAYVDLCKAAVATRELVKGWAWTQLVRGYEVWLAMVSKEVVEVLGYAPEWVQKAVLVGE
jgi:hypothetical protein